MTAIKTRPDAEAIEHLDFQHTPECEVAVHGSEPPAAAWWVDIHGCGQGFVCASCQGTARSLFARDVAIRGAVYCAFCSKRACRFEDHVTREVRI